MSSQQLSLSTDSLLQSHYHSLNNSSSTYTHHHHDMIQYGAEEEEEEDQEEEEEDQDVEPDDIDQLDDDDDMMDRISSSPSIDDEDIDFDFVYALHTFIATVDGQANASKGDTMVLLDDSNSYWWLVRVVKDGTIGYLPAEHIETPTERLARLNKHRNIDLSSTMLSDNAEKSKHSLKKVIRRRKNVMFAAPTYIEPSDAEWSTDEEDAMDDQFFEYHDAEGGDDTTTTAAAAAAQDVMMEEEEREREKDEDEEREREKDEEEEERVLEEFGSDEHGKDGNGLDHNDITIEPLRPRSSSMDKNGGLQGLLEKSDSPSRQQQKADLDPLLERDSFETKKISLTPNLLRDDDQKTVSQYEIKESKNRGSLDTWEKIVSDKTRGDDKKKKEKKSVLSGLFKRKDRRLKSMDDEYGSGGGSGGGSEDLEFYNNNNNNNNNNKMMLEDDGYRPGSSSNYSLDSLSKSPVSPASPTLNSITTATTTATTTNGGGARLGWPDGERNKVMRNMSVSSDSISQQGQQQQQQQQQNYGDRNVDGSKDIDDAYVPRPLNVRSSQVLKSSTVTASAAAAAAAATNSTDAPAENPFETTTTTTTTAEQRTTFFDDPDMSSSDDEEFSELSDKEEHDHDANGNGNGNGSEGNGGYNDGDVAMDAEQTHRNPHSASAAPPAVNIHASSTTHDDPEDRANSTTPSTDRDEARTPEFSRSRHDDHDGTRAGTPSSPSVISSKNRPSHSHSQSHSQSQQQARSGSAAGSGGCLSPLQTPNTPNTPTWSDASLRSFLDDSDRVRDLFIIVHDRSNILPAGPEHPITGGLFKEETRALDDMSSRLDELLNHWLVRKGIVG